MTTGGRKLSVTARSSAASIAASGTAIKSSSRRTRDVSWIATTT